MTWKIIILIHGYRVEKHIQEITSGLICILMSWQTKTNAEIFQYINFNLFKYS